MQKEIQKSMSCREVVTRHLRIFVSDGIINERKKIRRSRIKSGMTPLFNNSGFTLIELLVVVLIIGILAAVALPQYQKAVEKSRAAQAITLLKSVYNAAKAYQLAGGEWPQNFDELAVEIPWTGTTNGLHTGWALSGKSNPDWSIQIETDGPAIIVTRIAGPYAGAAFAIYKTPRHPQYAEDELLCIELQGTDPISPFSKTQGDYCQKIMKGTFIPTTSAWNYFRMP